MILSEEAAKGAVYTQHRILRPPKARLHGEWIDCPFLRLGRAYGADKLSPAWRAPKLGTYGRRSWPKPIPIADREQPKQSPLLGTEQSHDEGQNPSP